MAGVSKRTAHRPKSAQLQAFWVELKRKLGIINTKILNFIIL